MAWSMSLMMVCLGWCLLLGSLVTVSGQIIVRIAESREPETVDYTGQIRQFSEIGPGGPNSGDGRVLPRPLVCYTDDSASDAEWQWPNGNVVPPTPSGFTQAVGDVLYQLAVDGSRLVLIRGPDYNSPDGEYCCVITTVSGQRRCVTLTTCPMLPFPTNGNITYDPDTDVATHSCDPGYALSNTGQRTCQSNDQWSGTTVTCERIMCPTLSNPENGLVTVNTRTVGGVATYTCNNGYNLTGASMRMCEEGSGVIGQWTPEEPTCPPVDCGPLNNPTNGQVMVPATTFNNMATYSCNSGYTLNGTQTRTCQASGVWNNTEPTCEGDGLGTNAGAIVGGVIVALIAIAGIVVGVVIIVFFVRRRLQNQPKHSSAPKALPRDTPEKPLPYSTRYTKPANDEQPTLVFAKEEGPSIVEFPSETRAVEGEEVYLKVKVGGHPPPTLTWYHDGKEVTPDYATELDDDGGVTFPSVEAKHAGMYRLEATNSLGSVEQQVRVTVSAEHEESPSHSANLGPVSVDQLGGYVTELHTSDNHMFKANYKALDSGEKGHKVTVAKIPENKLCNRFGNIAVYDDNRIVLQTIPGREDCQSDYINACYVDGYSVPRKFVATQGPTPRTLVDFWRLLWQERPPIIVMLTNLKEGNKIKCQPYWPESGKKKFGPFTVTITDQQVLADYTIRTLKVTVEGERKVLKTTQFHFTAWPDHGVPDYASPILGFHRRVKSQHNPSKGPLLVHCSAGVGRTGTYIVIDNVLEQIAAEGVVDISGAIVKARNQRMKLVQTQDQYTFIHDAILESVTCGDTQISAGDLRRQIQNMSQVARGKNCTGFQFQFQILDQVTPKPNEVISTTAQRNLDKNRGKQYLPADKCRVILKGEQPDYIHAVFAHGYKHQKAYIIAQNPLPSTVRNFWKVIYDRKCAAVVMLTPLGENGKEVCSQYWPETGGVTTFGEYTIDHLGEESNPGFMVRQLSVLSEKTKQAHQVTQFQILNWNRDGVCDNYKTVTDVNEEVAKVQRRTGNKSIVVHCSDTATRSGMFCAIATTIDRCKTEGVVDVFQVVKALRVHKPGAVPSVENYRNTFDALLVYLESFDTYANFQQ